MEQQFNVWLRNRRHDHGLSRDELGAAIGVSGDYIGKLEQGVKDPSPKLKVRLEKFFDPQDEMPEWMMEKLREIAKEIGSAPQDIINTLVYQFIKNGE